MSNDLGQQYSGSAISSGSKETVEELCRELFRLRREIEQVQQEFDDTKAGLLLQANEKLVLATIAAAMEAERIADETAIKLSELTQSTQRDMLTDTPNRALMVDRLHNAILMSHRRESSFAVFFVDIDKFKEVNDTLGHAVGDEVLQVVARRLEGAVRASDTVSRHGGDEFVVLLNEISDPADAALVAEKMLHALEAPNALQTAPALTLSASIGVAICPQDGEDAASLINNADEAMYCAKRSGGGVYRFHHAVEPQGDTDPAAASADPQQASCPEHTHAHYPDQRDLRDVNEQLLLSSLALQESEAGAVNAHEQQVKFLAMVSHELRNPLSPISSAAELLTRARNDEEQHAKLREMIQRQVSHLARIIDDLLDSSRVQTGKFHLEPGTIDLVEVLRLALEACSPLVEARLQRLHIQLPSEPIWISGDPVRLTQVFRNLLDNASKYTPTGGVVSLAANCAEDTCVVSVTDNGIGIAPEVLPHVFDLFTQDSRAVTFHGLGLGIGLTVVHELVKAHGGSISASSAGHELGSEFLVTLPLLTTDLVDAD